MLLAIDTSAGTSVSIVDNGKSAASGNPSARVLATAESADPRAHAEVLDGLIASVLSEAGISPKQLTGVVAGMGPGPFTGLRVGIAAARVFAFGAGVPVIPVVSHDAIAFGIGGPTLVVTDARRREVYWSAYSGTDEAGLPVREHGPALCKPAELAASVANFERFERMDAATVPATNLGLLAAALLAHDRPLATGGALYLRSPDVTISAGPKRVTS